MVARAIRAWGKAVAPALALCAGTAWGSGLVSPLQAERLGDIHRGAQALADRHADGGPEVDELMGRLRAAGWTERFAALAALGELGPSARRAIPTVVALAKDGNEAVRGLVDRTLGRLGFPAPSSMQELLLLLEDPDERVRTLAERSVLTYGEAGRIAVEAVRERRRREERERGWECGGQCRMNIRTTSGRLQLYDAWVYGAGPSRSEALNAANDNCMNPCTQALPEDRAHDCNLRQTECHIRAR